MVVMALVYIYDATELDKQQLSAGLAVTDHRWEYVDGPISVENLNPETEVLAVFVSSTVTRDIIERLPKLRLIACRSTGFNNVDLQAASEHDVTVVNVPTYGEATVAEYTFALLLSLTRKLPYILTDRDMKPSEASRGRDLSGKVLGVIGTGHIGQRVIAIAKGFDMKVIAYDPFPNLQQASNLGFTYATLEDLLASADIVTLHVPYMPATHHLINAARLQQMKEGSILVNTARGEIVDSRALVEALQDGHLGGAALDVVEGEHLLNLDEETQLLRSDTLPARMLEHSVEIMALQHMPHVIITPHNAFNTIEAIQRINSTTVQNIVDYWYGNVPNVVKSAKPPIGKLVLSRHAESEWNATGQWTGITDVHLSEKGFHEAGLLGKAFALTDIKLDKAYCSQQIRTLETLEGILDTSGQLDVPFERTDAINERDYGEYTGKNKWEMKELLGDERFNQIRRGWEAEIPGGETLKEVYDRVVPFYKKTVLPELLSGRNVLMVGHGNGLRALIKYMEKISDKDVEDLEMIFGDIIVYGVDEKGYMVDKKVQHIDSPPPQA